MSSFIFALLLYLHLNLCYAQILDVDNSNSNKPQNIDNLQSNLAEQQSANIEVKIVRADVPDIDKDELEEVLLHEDDANNLEIDNKNNIDADTDANEPIHKKTTNKPSSTQPKYAWVSMVDRNVTSVIGARVLSQSLSKHKSTADRIIICIPGVSDKAIHMLSNFGWQIHSISVNMFDKIKHYPEHIRHVLLKTLMFNFTEYESVGYISPQSMVTTNIDHLFQCGSNALCATTNDKHHQIYHNNQRHTKQLLSNIEHILYDEKGQIITKPLTIPNHESIFDDNIFIMAPEHDLYLDIFTFISTSYDALEQSELQTNFPSYLSEYFYHYCKGNGYPISRQSGQYSAPKVTFNCSDSPISGSAQDHECKMNKEISKSPCYILPEGYNFHPSHNDHISASWHWKQSIKHLAIKIIQYNIDNFKPWQWKNVLFSGWMIQFNIYATVRPNLYFEYLLLDEAEPAAKEELILSLWQKPVLFLVFGVIFMLALTALSAPIFKLLSFLINQLSPLLIYVLLRIYQWLICPFLLIYNIMIIVSPIKQIFIDEDIIPQSYPYKIAWILALQYCYFSSCFTFVMMCFVMYWCGKMYHPIRFKIKWFDYLQLKLFAFNNVPRKYYQRIRSPIHKDIESGGKYFMYQNKRESAENSLNTVWFTRIILKFQHLRMYLLHNILLKYFSILVLVVLKWCLWYFFCIVTVLSTVWILRFNDWHELKVIVGTELILSLSWISYCSVNTYCQFFIYPQIVKYGEKYYDSDAFEKGI